MVVNKNAWAILLALTAAISWGAMGICAQYLIRNFSFQPLDLVSIRLFCAGVILLVIYRVIGGTGIMSVFQSKKDFLQVTIAGFTFLGSQLSFMKSIQVADASLATIIFTTIPVMCACYYCLRDRKLPSLHVCLCFVLASVGVSLVVTDGDFNSVKFSVEGLFWGLVSAALCAFYSIFPQAVIRKLGVSPVVGWAMVIGGIFSCMFNPPWAQQAQWTWTSLAFFAFIVLIGTVLAFWSYLSSVRYLSPVLVSLIGCMEPVTAYILLIIFFGRTVGWYELLGIIFVFANVMIISTRAENK